MSLHCRLNALQLPALILPAQNNMIYLYSILKTFFLTLILFQNKNQDIIPK